VQVVKVAEPSAWQERQREFDRQQQAFLDEALT
jgi:hypothetical protein